MQGLERISGNLATRAEMRSFIAEVLPFCFNESRQEYLIWLSSKIHALVVRHEINKLGYEIYILAGSIKNKSKPWWKFWEK